MYIPHYSTAGQIQDIGIHPSIYHQVSSSNIVLDINTTLQHSRSDSTKIKILPWLSSNIIFYIHHSHYICFNFADYIQYRSLPKFILEQHTTQNCYKYIPILQCRSETCRRDVYKRNQSTIWLDETSCPATNIWWRLWRGRGNSSCERYMCARCNWAKTTTPSQVHNIRLVPWYELYHKDV